LVIFARKLNRIKSVLAKELQLAIRDLEISGPLRQTNQGSLVDTRWEKSILAFESASGGSDTQAGPLTCSRVCPSNRSVPRSY